MAKILIVEDSWVTRRIIVGILKADGHELLEAGGGKEGLEMAEKHMPDCILLDLLMPEMDGFDVLEALGKKGLKIPVIVLTANIQKTVREKCLQLGAFAFTNKPAEEDELRSLVLKAIDLKKGAD